MLKQMPVTHHQNRFMHKRTIIQMPDVAGNKKASDFSSFYAIARQSNDSTEHSSSFPESSGQLLGREQELEELTTLLCSSAIRLVTLTGPGGVGKTRLALQVAANLRDTFVDGVYFVSLAAIRHPDEVLAAIAQMLAIEKSDDQSLLEGIKHVLRQKQLLLLIDTMEHVIAAAPYLAHLLASCSDLTILVTSRRELNLRAEQIFQLLPLSTPDLSVLPADYQDLLQYPAVALFMQRVHAVYHDFQLTDDNAGIIAEICVHLDGLPLALELAAARMKLMSPQGLLQRLRSSTTSLSVLTSGRRDAPTRHQTLRQNIAWSYSLLTPQEQRVFQRLSLFENSYTFAAIEAVCRDDAGAQSASLVDRVSALIEQNLLQMRWDKEKNEPRFMMLAAIRAYGQECLKNSGEEAAARQAHAAYLRTLTQATIVETAETVSTDQKRDLDEEEQMREKRESSLVPLTLPNTNLTAREIEVLRLIAQGLTSLQIAHRLTITTLTVNSHVRSIYNKLGINTRSAATRYAIEQNLL